MHRSGEDSMTPTPKTASGATARTDAAEQAKSHAADVGPFVLNLCSSTTPMALAKSEQPELKRFSFFVSRRFEEGRERFRLHMGYFNTLAEAEEWLGAVRDIYPGAWAGEAPGKKLRERALAAAAAQAQHAAGPPPQAVAAPTVPVARSAPNPVPIVAMNVPTIHAANATLPTAASINRPAPTAKPAPVAARLPVATPISAASSVSATRPLPPKAASTQRSVPPAPVAMPRPAQTARAAQTSGAVPGAAARGAPAVATAHPGAATAAKTGGVGVSARTASSPGAARVAPVTARNTPPARAASAATTHQQKVAQASTSRTQGASSASRQGGKSAKPVLPNSNVREVLKALDEISTETTGETRMMPAPDIQALGSADDASFTDTQVLNFLEARRADGSETSGIDVESGAISLLKPDDTGTRRALKEAVNSNAPVWFAVQLQWSVQPVELVKVPPLAIFSAYTLYTVEGSRDGRKWFGLRLGFFSDAISAKQVAYYVRSEFTSVAVVPVSPQERTRASESGKKTAGEIGSPRKARSGPVEEFKLIDSDDKPANVPFAQPQPSGKPRQAAQPVRTASPAPAVAKRPTTKGATTVRARDRRGPQTLEETLEILGAGELEMDNGSGESMNESGVRHLRVEVQKNTPFSRLLERLSERVRKP
jgi:hypothetical protein